MRKNKSNPLFLQDTALFSSAILPPLPRNARYIYHENKCYDWGTFGWVFSEGKVNATLYKSIIFMNSSVRGPFLPPYFPVSMVACSWHACLEMVVAELCSC